jgi:hypothetical protein
MPASLPSTFISFEPTSRAALKNHNNNSKDNSPHLFSPLLPGSFSTAVYQIAPHTTSKP